MLEATNVPLVLRITYVRATMDIMVWIKTEQEHAKTHCMVLKQDVSVLQTRRVIYIVLTKGTLVIIGATQGCATILQAKN